MKTFKKQFAILLIVVSVFSCNKNDDAIEKDIVLSSEKQITNFVFLLANNPIAVNVVAEIDEDNKTITATMPLGTDITGLIPDLDLSNLATVNHTTAKDFTEPVEYIITAEDNSETVYTVIVNVLLDQREILQLILDANPNNILNWDLDSTPNLEDLGGVVLNAQGEIILLNLSSKQITSIPTEIGQLSNLESLTLNSNQLTSIPLGITQLSNLEYLSLENNAIHTIPLEIKELTHLEHLNLGFNNITTIPIEIEQLSNLKDLILSVNAIQTIPIEIGQLSNLTHLSLGGNAIQTIPIEIWQLNNLIELHLNNNSISSIPPEIGQLSHLNELSINNNNLSSIPPEIAFLNNLEHLRLHNNTTTILPVSIFFLHAISANNLTVSFINNFTIAITSQKDALISIHSNNPGNTLGWGVNNFPGVSFHANNTPKIISMKNKNLIRIPYSIGELDALETLNINDNNIKFLPTSISDVTTLETLTAAHNELNTVPKELSEINNLTLLTITNNPITSIPQEVCDKQIANGGVLTIVADPGEGCN